MDNSINAPPLKRCKTMRGALPLPTHRGNKERTELRISLSQPYHYRYINFDFQTHLVASRQRRVIVTPRGEGHPTERFGRPAHGRCTCGHVYLGAVPKKIGVYGLALEQILSPNAMNFLVDRGTLLEEHIAGIPGSP